MRLTANANIQYFIALVSLHVIGIRDALVYPSTLVGVTRLKKTAQETGFD